MVVRKAADEFSKEIHHPINDTEAAYLTVYFSQHMQQTTSRASRVRVLLVVSEMKEEERESLKYQLEDSMPMFVAAAVCTKREYPAVNRDSYDIIVSTVLLDCPDSYALVSEYMDVCASMLRDRGSPFLEVRIPGDNLSECVMNGIILGDYVSLELAELKGVDPQPVPAITEFKERLKGGV